MSKSENEKWIATIPSQSSANNRKIDLVSDLLIPYSELSVRFLKDIDLHKGSEKARGFNPGMNQADGMFKYTYFK